MDEQANLSTLKIPIERLNKNQRGAVEDSVAVEEPLEIRLGYWNKTGEQEFRTLSITMRTPGNDLELAAGFLFTEGIISHTQQIDTIRHCGPQSPGTVPSRNIVRVELSPSTPIDFSRLQRHFYTTSSCGVCGKTSIEALKTQGPYQEELRSLHSLQVPSSVLRTLPEKLELAQGLFSRTGGIHASGLFLENGTLIALREDVGRHNALDKIIGWGLQNYKLPLSQCIVLVSGRASFELMQKTAMAGIPMLAAIGAPSSLAVELAQEFNMTLIGFLKNHRFNIYHGNWRVTS